MVERFAVDDLDDIEPFEVDTQAAHLFKHPGLGIEDVAEAWVSRRSTRPPRRRAG